MQRKLVMYWIDESVTTVIGRFLRHTGFDAQRVAAGTSDSVNLARIRDADDGRPYVLITADLRMKSDHAADVVDSGASVAWIHVNGDDSVTQFFAAFTFVYQMYDRLSAATTPRYFDVTLQDHDGLPTVQIATSDFDAPDIG